MVDSYTDDKSKYRSGVVTYTVEDRIGRSDANDKVQTSSYTTSGTVTLLPESPLGRRNHIKVTNVGSVNVAILTASGQAVAEGYIVAASGGTWEDDTDGTFYIVSTGADSEVTIYERATKVWNSI